MPAIEGGLLSEDMPRVHLVQGDAQDGVQVLHVRRMRAALLRLGLGGHLLLRLFLPPSREQPGDAEALLGLWDGWDGGVLEGIERSVRLRLVGSEGVGVDPPRFPLVDALGDRGGAHGVPIGARARPVTGRPVPVPLLPCLGADVAHGAGLEGVGHPAGWLGDGEISGNGGIQ